mgnify:CR=1 FL=1
MNTVEFLVFLGKATICASLDIEVLDLYKTRRGIELLSSFTFFTYSWKLTLN